MGPRFEAGDPATQSVRPAAMMAAHGPRPVDKQKAQIAIATLTDAAQRRLATGRMLQRHQSEPRRKISPLGKRGTVADRRHDGGRGERADAGHPDQATTGVVLTRKPGNFLIDVVDGSSSTRHSSRTCVSTWQKRGDSATAGLAIASGNRSTSARRPTWNVTPRSSSNPRS